MIFSWSGSQNDHCKSSAAGNSSGWTGSERWGLHEIGWGFGDDSTRKWRITRKSWNVNLERFATSSLNVACSNRDLL